MMTGLLQAKWTWHNCLEMFAYMLASLDRPFSKFKLVTTSCGSICPSIEGESYRDVESVLCCIGCSII